MSTNQWTIQSATRDRSEQRAPDRRALVMFRDGGRPCRTTQRTHRRASRGGSRSAFLPAPCRRRTAEPSWPAASAQAPQGGGGRTGAAALPGEARRAWVRPPAEKGGVSTSLRACTKGAQAAAGAARALLRPPARAKGPISSRRRRSPPRLPCWCSCMRAVKVLVYMSEKTASSASRDPAASDNSTTAH